MRWIENKDEFSCIYRQAHTGVFIDSGREETSLRRLVFDSVTLANRKMSDLLQTLMSMTDEGKCNVVLLDPDPIWAFKERRGRYPMFEIGLGDSSQVYIDALATNLCNDPNFTMGLVYGQYAVVSPSIRWFIHAYRSSDSRSGHLWVPGELKDQLQQKHSWLSD